MQSSEREKLLFIAAHHIDILQDNVQSLADVMGGKSEKNRDYLAKQIAAIEEKITDAMEGVMSLKSDILFA